MLRVITGESSKGYILKSETERSKVMYKYEQMKRFHHDQRLQVYMYAFIYFYPDIMPVGEHFPDTKTFFVNYPKTYLR